MDQHIGGTAQVNVVVEAEGDALDRAPSGGSAPAPAATTVRVEEYEYMQDLRSKLIMAELPPEVAPDSRRRR